MVRVRFAPSPTGSLHLGGALSAVANRRFADERGGSFLLRIDDTDAARNVEGGAEAIATDLEWLGVHWDEGPLLQSERFVRHREAAHQIGEPDAEGALRFGQLTLLRPDGTSEPVKLTAETEKFTANPKSSRQNSKTSGQKIEKLTGKAKIARFPLPAFHDSGFARWMIR